MIREPAGASLSQSVCKVGHRALESAEGRAMNCVNDAGYTRGFRREPAKVLGRWRARSRGGGLERRQQAALDSPAAAQGADVVRHAGVSSATTRRQPRACCTAGCALAGLMIMAFRARRRLPRGTGDDGRSGEGRNGDGRGMGPDGEPGRLAWRPSNVSGVSAVPERHNNVDVQSRSEVRLGSTQAGPIPQPPSCSSYRPPRRGL